MSKPQSMLEKTYPIEANAILGMASGIAASALHHYQLNPKSEESKLFAETAIPAVRHTIMPIVEDAYRIAADQDDSQDDFLLAVHKTVLLIEQAIDRAVELGLAEKTPTPTIQ